MLSPTGFPDPWGIPWSLAWSSLAFLVSPLILILVCMCGLSCTSSCDPLSVLGAPSSLGLSDMVLSCCGGLLTLQLKPVTLACLPALSGCFSMKLSPLKHLPKCQVETWKEWVNRNYFLDCCHPKRPSCSVVFGLKLIMEPKRIIKPHGKVEDLPCATSERCFRSEITSCNSVIAVNLV